MTRPGLYFSDAVVQAVGEGESFLCHRLDGHGVVWVLLALGKLIEILPDGSTRAFWPTVEQAASDGWHVSTRGPRTVRRRKAS